MKLNVEEVVIGAAVAGSVLMVSGVVWFPPLLAIPFLWALGGSINKAYRRYGVPSMVLLALGMAHGWDAVAASAVMCAALHLGYGIPSTQPPDEGSWLARIWARIVPEGVLDGAVRASYGFLVGVGFLLVGTLAPALLLMAAFPIIEETV